MHVRSSDGLALTASSARQAALAAVERVAVVTASARSLPAMMYSVIPGVVEK